MCCNRNALYLFIPFIERRAFTCALLCAVLGGEGPTTQCYEDIFLKRKPIKKFIKCKRKQSQSDGKHIPMLVESGALLPKPKSKRGNHFRAPSQMLWRYRIYFIYRLAFSLAHSGAHFSIRPPRKNAIRNTADIDKFPFVYCFIWNAKCSLMIML